MDRSRISGYLTSGAAIVDHISAFWPHASLCINRKFRTFLLTLILRVFYCAKVKCESRVGIMATIGYCRVSTDGQSLAAQESALREAGCTKLFAEKASGAKSNRAQLAKAIATLAKGDVLIVTRLDRLARSTRDLLNTLHTIAGAGAGFKSLADIWADTTTMHGRLMLTVLGGLAEFERELIKVRTSDGRKRAQERGVKFGRPAKLTPHQRREAIARLQAGETQADVARTYGVAHTTIGRLSASLG